LILLAIFLFSRFYSEDQRERNHKPRRPEFFPPRGCLDTVLACVLFASFLKVFSRTVADPDLWGHIRFGEDVLRTGRIIQADVYSYLTGDQPWINHEWLTEVIFYLVFTVAGAGGLVGFKTAISLLVVGLLYRDLRKHGLGTLRSGIIGALAALLLLPYLGTLRPQAFTFFLFLILLIVIREVDRGRVRYISSLPFVFAVWVNLHGGFLAGIGILFVWLAVYFTTTVFREREVSVLFTSASLRIVLAAVVTLFSTLLNPYGVQLWSFLFRTATVPRPDIIEWQPMNLMTLEGQVYLVLLAASAMGLFFSERERSPSLVAVLVCTAVVPLLAHRHTPLFGLAAVVLACEHIADVWNRWSPLRAGVPKKLPYRLVVGLNLVGAAVLIALSSSNFDCVRLNPKAVVYPARAISLLKDSGVSGNLAVHFDWGEYALWHLAPGIKVSVDGRRETVYSDEIYRVNLDYMRGTGEWDALLEKHDTHLSLVSKEFPVFNLMKLKPGWALIYEDPISGLFVQDGSAQAEKLRRTQVSAIPYDGAGLCFP
jgi:hypothetical protein